MEIRRTPDLLSSGQHLTDRLINELKSDKNVFWLVPGGSNIELAVRIMDAIPADLTDNLTILLTDERYGLWDHADSNYRQLYEAGFDKKRATFLPALSRSNASFESTIGVYGHTIADHFSVADTIIGHFGMGADGHIAGILPESPAVSSEELVAGYPSESFTRITLTFNAIRQLSAAYVFAFGEEKRQALENLQTDMPLEKQPAQIIKELPESFVYNDLIGEKI